MGISIHIDYKFIYNGKTYKAIGKLAGETENIKSFELEASRIYELKVLAVGLALHIPHEEAEALINKCFFDYVDLYL